jgi:3-hydroxyacyl-CoA dehydrogenase
MSDYVSSGAIKAWSVEGETPATQDKLHYRRGHGGIKRVAVLGAGTMGAQIAALLASHGIRCDLIDMASDGSRNQIAEQAKKRLSAIRPLPHYIPKALDLISPGNFIDDLGRIENADWVIEAVVENVEIKKDLWSKVAPYLRLDAIASSNTSGIPIASLAQALPKKLRARFLGTHFFNPPRVLHLMELIPWTGTEEEVVHRVTQFAEDVLGKGVVIARDVPYFIANRIGMYGILATLRAMNEFDLKPDEVDAITGPVMGRSTSATFRTLDLVGLDVVMDICDNLQHYLGDGGEDFRLPEYIREMVRQGWTGDKSGQGFYKRSTVDGKNQVMVLDLETFQYRPRIETSFHSIAAASGLEALAQRLKSLISAEDVASRFAWRVVSQLMAYCAQMIESSSDDLVSIDRAMRWGFAWEIGPFEVWDALGLPSTCKRMKEEGLSLPSWVEELSELGQTFYRSQSARIYQATSRRTYSPVPLIPRSISLDALSTQGTQVLRKPGWAVHDMGDGVAFLDFSPPKQAIDLDTLDMIEDICGGALRNFRGVVLGSQARSNFCVGANLGLILAAAQKGDWEGLDSFIRRLQYGLLGIKRLSIPLVAAPYGFTLGGGLELVLAARSVVASAECYLGLVEAGVGVIPAGGGCKEMLLRALEGLPGGVAAFSSGPRSGPPSLFADIDPGPALALVFETIGQARISGSGLEARNLGFLRSSDIVVSNSDQLLFVAKERAIALSDEGFKATSSLPLPILGGSARAILELSAQHLVWGGNASEHDLKIARKVAYVLTGGNRQPGTSVEEEYFLELEREAFLSLCGESKTQDRITHMLQTGRQLRN